MINECDQPVHELSRPNFLVHRRLKFVNLGLRGPSCGPVSSFFPGKITMFFELSARAKELQIKLSAFMDEHIYPNEKTFSAQVQAGDRWRPTAIVEELKAKARAAGLWNLFLPDHEQGAGLTNL